MVGLFTASRDARQFSGSDPPRTPTPCFTGGSDDEVALPASAETGQEHTKGAMFMRNDSSNANPCQSTEPGHCLDPHLGAGFPVRSENWVPAHIKVVVDYRAGKVVMVYAEGSSQRFFAHDLFTISRLLKPARAFESKEFGALFNEQGLVIALPAAGTDGLLLGASIDAEMVCFSVSSEPLTPCVLHRDEALAREFARVTAVLGC